VGAIRKYNKSLRNSNAKAGQNLFIPISSSRSARTTQEKESAGKKTFVADEKLKYKVKKGDTLSSVSRNFNISVSEIKKMNRINGDVLKVDQILKFDNKARSGKELPKTESLGKARVKEDNNDKMSAKTGREQKKYVVKKGDNLNKIAQQNGSNIDQLRQLNNLSKEDVIIPGQVIVVR
jgi:LysM repeat protein